MRGRVTKSKRASPDEAREGNGAEAQSGDQLSWLERGAKRAKVIESVETASTE